MKKSKHQQKVKQKVKEKKTQESRDNQDLDTKAYCHS